MNLQEILNIKQSTVCDIIREYVQENKLDLVGYGNGIDAQGSFYIKKLFKNNPELLNAFNNYSFDQYGQLIKN